jgi:mRNA interferase MazF
MGNDDSQDFTHVCRGDIVLVRLHPAEGSEQRGMRPCVVIQNDAANRAISTTIVAPLSTSYPTPVPPYLAELKATRTAVREDSAVLCNQLRTVSVPHRVLRNFGSLDHGSREMRAIEQALEVQLELEN